MRTSLFNELISVCLSKSQTVGAYQLFGNINPNYCKANTKTFSMLLNSTKSEDEIDNVIKYMFASNFNYNTSKFLYKNK